MGAVWTTSRDALVALSRWLQAQHRLQSARPKAQAAFRRAENSIVSYSHEASLWESRRRSWSLQSTTEVIGTLETERRTIHNELRRGLTVPNPSTVSALVSSAPGAAGVEFSMTTSLGVRVPSLCRIGAHTYDMTSGERIEAAYPFCVPVLGNNLIVRGADPTETNARRVVTSLVTRLALASPPSKVQFRVFDPLRLGASLEQSIRLATDCPWLIAGAIRHIPGELSEDLAELLVTATNRNQRLLRGHSQDMQTIDRTNTTGGDPYIVLVAYDFPQGWDTRSIEQLRSLMIGGPRCGITSLIHDVHSTGELVFTAEGQTVSIAVGPKNVVTPPATGQQRYAVVRADAAPDLGVIGALSLQLAENLRALELPRASLLGLAESLGSATSDRGLSIPIGTAGTVPFTIELGDGSEDGSAVHGLVVGTTGSGKSRLLHAIVHGAAARYSPSNLQLVVIDLKGGVEFTRLDTDERKVGLPHVEVLAIESDAGFAVSVLEHVTEMLAERLAQFRSVGVADIATYRRRPGAVMPRILVVVDEFHLLFNSDERHAERAAATIDLLARQGRSAGIHLLLGTQSLIGFQGPAGRRQAILGQLGLRMALACNSDDSIEVLGDRSAAFLDKRLGEVRVSHSGANPSQVISVRVANVSDDALTAMEGVIASRWEHSTTRRVLRGDRPPVLTRADVGPLAHEDVTEIAIPLGRSAILGQRAAISVSRRQARHILIGGAGRQNAETAATMLASIAAAMRLLAPGCDILVVDGGLPNLLSAFGQVDGHVEFLPTTVSSEQTSNTMSRWAESSDAAWRFLLVGGFHRLGDEVLQVLGSLMTARSANPITVVSHVDSASTVAESGSLRLRDFPIRIGLTMSGAEARELLGGRAASAIPIGRASLYDREMDGVTDRLDFTPYAAILEKSTASHPLEPVGQDA
jgi:FtsK/SpoIIIE family